MIEWTESAKKVWADYLSRTRASLEGTGADPQEVLEDLKRHVEEEISAARLGIATEEDLRRILAKFGPTASATPDAGTPLQADGSARHGSNTLPRPPGVLLLILGVLLPVITILFEWFTGISAEALFDPMPTWFHVVVVALVPISNSWLWMAARRRHSDHEGWLGWLSGFVLGVCIYYSILYLLFAPIACMGLIYFGLGLIPLTPYLALVGTFVLRHKYCQATGADKLPGNLLGVAIGLACLLLLQLPESLTYYGLSCATAEDKATQDYGLKELRAVGNRTIMLRACYGWLQYREIFNPINLLATGGDGRNISSERARELYYRVTGEAFNSVPPPKFYTRAGRWTELEDEYVWDEGLGGDQVAGRVKGLSLLSSRMDTTTEPDAGLGYCEWTMEFKNISAMQREARAQIALPPGAVVSRVTLWIDGEEREAAFGGRSQTRKAYQEEAVQRRHDPLLVTTCGPDRVLVQCFPIPPNGGVMKIRLGMTAPLILDSLESGSFVWPHFLERNFGIGPEFKHSLWLEQPGTDNKMAGIHESLSESNLTTSLHATVIHRHATIDTVWTPAATSGQMVQQTIRPVHAPAPARIILVLDGSAAMKSHLAEIARALDQIPETAEMAVVMASDESPQGKIEILRATAGNKAKLQKLLRKAKFSGGQDNLPALEAAWDLADAVEGGDVVWVHLPEPFELSSDSGISQRLERNRKQTRLYEIQLNNGPDRVVEKLDGFPSIEQVISIIPGQTGFDRLLNLWSGRLQTFSYARLLTNDQAGIAPESRASKHLSRLWARDESLRLAGSHQGEAATKLAAQNQLVTPLTGAVVLETKAQFDRHNLTPADPDSVPAIPEPNHLTMFALVIAMYALWRKLRLAKKRD